MRRRTFLLGSAAAVTAGFVGFGRKRAAAPIAGELLGASYRIGHLLRAGGLPAPSSERRIAVAIVGGGIAGLTAGWKLARAGFGEFEILELEAECGGNSRFGENAVSRYPWGAHYVPVPSRESRAVRELFEELGVIEGYDDAGAPRCREQYLCFSPQERLFIHGRWQEGLLPLVGATRRDLDEYARFKDLVHGYRERRGADGRKAFVIPMELSSRDASLLDLDRLSIRQFLVEQGFTSRGLHWYVDYACRDDFGCRSSDVSAWAGVHYFASRGEESAVVTWPEGNGWLAERLRQRLAKHLRPRSLVYRVENGPRARVVLEVFDPIEQRSTRITADQVIFAAPTHMAKFVVAGAAQRNALDEFQYAPWMVANLTLRGLPDEGTGPPLSWDNVIHDSDSLGYVVATHQSLRTRFDGTVLTYYFPLAGSAPDRERQRLLDTPWSTWTRAILRDLSRPHPDIGERVSRIDVFRWGHAMVRPRPGFLAGDARRQAATPIGNVHFANSDLSGFSLFEEAQYRGVHAAERVLEALRVPFTSSL
ncbi:MAG TPA: FAD-dependent oxidoreductase [Candidatus Binatia bacterium]|nr:FAD-dependent oxidoreductase [Candidatus Binatia bacterium]